MKVYALYSGQEPICEVEVETVPWLPVKPRINRAWLKLIVENALRSYFQQLGSVVKA